MLTNLVASIVVSMVTNVTERVPTHWENRNEMIPVYGDTIPKDPYTPRTFTLPMPIPNIGQHEVPDPDPKQKWVRTVIKRVTTLSFDFEGQHYSVDKEQIVSDKEVEYILERKERWLTAEKLDPDDSLEYWAITNTPNKATNHTK